MKKDKHLIGKPSHGTYRLNWTVKTSSVTGYMSIVDKAKNQRNAHLHRCEATFYAETTDHIRLVPLTVSRIAQDFVRRIRTDR